MFYIRKKGLGGRWFFYTGNGSSLYILDAFPFFREKEAMDIAEKDGLEEYIIVSHRKAWDLTDKATEQEV